jgi:hypothetical protein
VSDFTTCKRRRRRRRRKKKKRKRRKIVEGRARELRGKEDESRQTLLSL